MGVILVLLLLVYTNALSVARNAEPPGTFMEPTGTVTVTVGDTLYVDAWHTFDKSPRLMVWQNELGRVWASEQEAFPGISYRRRWIAKTAGPHRLSAATMKGTSEWLTVRVVYPAAVGYGFRTESRGVQDFSSPDMGGAGGRLGSGG